MWKGAVGPWLGSVPRAVGADFTGQGKPLQVPSDQWGSGEAELKLELYSFPVPPRPVPHPIGRREVPSPHACGEVVMMMRRGWRKGLDEFSST